MNSRALATNTSKPEQNIPSAKDERFPLRLNRKIVKIIIKTLLTVVSTITHISSPSQYSYQKHFKIKVYEIKKVYADLGTVPIFFFFFPHMI